MKSVLGDKRAILILLGPALLLYTLIKLVPVLWSLGLSFFEGNVLRGFTFIGVDNFVDFFQDPNALEAMGFTLKYSVVLSIGQILLGYGLALLYTFALRRSSPIVRTLVFFPVVIPTVAVGLLFSRLFQYAPQTGIVNTGLEAVGADAVDWFGTGDSAFIVLVIMELWKSMGFYAVLLFAGLVDIPEEMIESARLDGASGIRLVWHIIVPLSLPVLLSAVIFSFNATLKVFDPIVALTNGGPGNDTTPLTLYMFRTVFTYNDYGYGSTIATVLTIMCFIVTLFIFNSSRKDLTKG